MKQFSYLLILLFAFSFILLSCSKNIDHTDPNFVAGEEALVNKDYKKASEHFENYFKEYPQDASAALYCGFAHYFMQEYYKAINDFTTAIELDPNYPDSYNGRAKSYYEIGVFDKAIKDWEKCLELGCENPDETKKNIEDAKRRSQ